MSGQVRTRMQWHDLPVEMTTRIEQILGAAVVEAASQANGFSPGSADRVVTADGDRAFVKAVPRARNEDSYRLHQREIEVMKLLPPGVSAPALLGSIVTDEWAVLVLADIAGRHPDGGEGGADVEAVLDAFATLPPLTGHALGALPSAAEEFRAERDSWQTIASRAIDVPEWTIGNRRRLHAAAERVCDVVAGEHLQHLDARADNVLVDAGGRAWIIDWPWASAGVRWLDGLLYLLDVRERGEDVDTEAALRTHPLFAAAAAEDVDAVLSAVTGGFFVKAALPAPASMPTIRAFQHREAIAAMTWLQQRWDRGVAATQWLG